MDLACMVTTNANSSTKTTIITVNNSSPWLTFQMYIITQILIDAQNIFPNILVIIPEVLAKNISFSAFKLATSTFSKINFGNS